jgi:hypothetical protein
MQKHIQPLERSADRLDALIRAPRARGIARALRARSIAIAGTPLVLAAPVLAQHTAPLYPNAEYLTARASPQVSLVAADLDGDGRIDLVTGDGIGDKVQILFSNGEGGFRPIVDVQAFEGAGSIAIGDVDEDGIPDLVVACQAAGSVVFLRGLGGGHFAPPFGWFPNTTPSAVALADLDRDGHLDLVIGNQDSHEISVRRGDGHGGFGTPWIASLSGTPTSIELADFDRDGWSDLAVVYGDRITPYGVAVFLGDGTGNFRFSSDEPSSSKFGISLAVGDLDADGIPDLALLQQESDWIEILPGDGHGGFGTPRSLPLYTIALSVAACDLNRDGHTDLIVCSLDPGTMRVWYGHANGVLTAGPEVPVSGQMVSVITADLDQDGLPDVALAARDQNTISVLHQSASGSFAIARSFASLSAQVEEVVSADVNGDGHPDLVYTGGGICCVLGDGAGGFSSPLLSSSHTWGGLAVADLDLDGLPDVVTSFTAGGITILKGRGDGSFGSPVDLRAGFSWTREFAVGDVDGNGWPDIVATVRSTSEVAVFLGTGQGAFAPPVLYPACAAPSRLAMGDLDGDGVLDLAVTSDASSAEITILPGDGRGGFPTRRVLRTEDGYHGLAIADVDADGRDDLLVESSLPDFTSAITVFLQDAGHSLQPHARYAFANALGNLHFADLDGDGRMDVYFAAYDEQVVVLLGDGHGGFPIRSAYIAAAHTNCGGSLAVDAAACDLDGDGRVDIAAVGGCAIAVLRNVLPSTPGLSICAGDGTAGFCPCGNPGRTGNGCDNAALTGGASLASSGSASLSNDTLSLASSGEPDTSMTIFLQGSTFVPQVPLGQGLLCAGGRVTRLYARTSSNGVAVAPGPNAPSVSSRSSALGDRLSAGSIRVYQVLYRDDPHGSCRAPFDLSSGQQISWGP